MNVVMAVAVFMVKLVGVGINSNGIGFVWCLRVVEGLRYASQIMMKCVRESSYSYIHIKDF